MKNKLIKNTITAAIMIIAGFMSRPAYCEFNNIALLVQQTPVEGGTVTPESGLHNFDSGMNLVITATPQSGYQFVYWIGDVDDSTSSRTTVYMNSPKIIIAVFERTKFDFLVKDELPQSQPGGGLIPSPSDYSNQGYSGSGSDGRRGSSFLPNNTESEHFPVPSNGDVNNLPVSGKEVPEPATISLLAMGALYFIRNNRKNSERN